MILQYDKEEWNKKRLFRSLSDFKLYMEEREEMFPMCKDNYDDVPFNHGFISDFKGEHNEIYFDMENCNEFLQLFNNHFKTIKKEIQLSLNINDFKQANKSK